MIEQAADAVERCFDVRREKRGVLGVKSVGVEFV